MALLRKSNSRGRALTRHAAGRALLIRLGVWSGVLTALVLLVFLFGVALERLFFSRNPHFVLREVEVHLVKGNVDPEFIRRKLEVIPGENNLYELDLAVLRQRLLQDPVIQEAEVSRLLPDRLVVNIYGRTPVAQLLRRGGMLVDGDGYVMAAGTREEMLNLPVIVGVTGAAGVREGTRLSEPGLQHVLQFLELRSVQPRGTWLDAYLVQYNEPYGELIVYLKENRECCLLPGSELVLPTRDLDQALARSLEVLEVRSLARQPTGYINGTYQRIPVLPYRP